MVSKRLSKLLLSFLVVASFILSSMSNYVSAAGEATTIPPTANSANDTVTSMIDFFRTERTGLAPKSVNTDELMVYGIFMSNFFMPWETKLKDIKDDSSDTSIVTRITSKFFGSSDKSASRKTGVKGVNELLYTAISNVLTSDQKMSFGLFPTPERGKDGKMPITGVELLEKLSQTPPDGGKLDMMLYNNGAQPVMDLGDKGIQAALQVLFGLSPDLFLRNGKTLDEGKGLQSITGLYLDGFGNIWGSYAADGSTTAKGTAQPPAVAVDDWVLIMPAALNPVVFSNNYTNTLFPVANVFVLGGVLKITDSTFLSGADYRTPYYNISKYFPKAQDAKQDYNSTNAINIFGIQSPTAFVGNTDAIIGGWGIIDSFSEVTKFLDLNYGSKSDNISANILVAVNPDKIPNISALMKSNELSVDQRLGLSSYLLETNSFDLNHISQEMYYFNVDQPNLTTASGESEGAWKDDSSLLTVQKMFTKETAEKGKFQFYNGSIAASPFSTRLDEYTKLSDDEKVKYLVDFIVANKKIDTNGDVFKALKTFFDTGSFLYTTANGKSAYSIDIINQAMKEMKDSDYMIYNVAISAKTEASVGVGGRTLSTLFKEQAYPVAYGLTNNDFNLAFESAFANLGWKGKLQGGSLDTVNPFAFSKTGGTINGNSPEELNAISNYFHTTMTYNLFSTNKAFNKLLTGHAAGTDIKTPLGKNAVQTKTAVMNEVNNYPGIYWGYMVKLLSIGPTTSTDGKKKWDSKHFKHSILPPMALGSSGGGLNLDAVLGQSGVVSSEDRTIEEMQKDIVKKVYGLLSDGPNNYRDKLIKSAQDSWIISTHRSITGSWIGNSLSVSAGGNSSYASVVGYINTPSLHDLPLTSWLLKDYMYIYMFLMLLVLIVLILMVMTNMRRVGEGVAILILMSFVLLLPQFLLSNVINISNSVGDKLYSARFNYWAITQHEQSIKTLNESRTSGNESDLIVAQSMQMAQNVYTSDAGVRVKWMSPKKGDTFDKMFNRNTATESLLSNLTLFRWLFNSYFNQEEYVYNDPMATYVYRPYNALASAAFNSYKDMTEQKTSPTRETVASRVSKVISSTAGIPSYRFAELLAYATNLEYTKDQSELIKSVSVFPLSSDSDKINSYRFWSLNNADVTTSIFRSKLEGTSQGLIETGADKYTDAFLLTTESPFYYFYNVFKSRYDSGGTDFNSSLLNEEVFKTVSATNLDANNKVRDFLDLEGLFTYVVPYLHQGNSYVYKWTDTYGKNLDSFSFKGEVAPSGALGDKFTAERDKKEALKQVWKMYTPWVDQMYSLDVIGKRTTIANKSVTVEDTINPGAYKAQGRPMVFSEADMFAKSYRSSDLTDVELRIQATLSTTYKDLMYLTNYYDFDHETLVTAAAMMATFNFNREFSNKKLLGESTMLYPQNFELKNFNYDAFMRLTLLNATGEALMAEKDLYVRMLDKTSLFTGLLLILCDLMAVVFIPTMKVVALLLLLFLSVAISVSCVMTPPEKIMKFIGKNLGVPAALFLVSSIGFAYVISLFMGEGLTGYVGGRAPELGVSDPTIMMGLMVVVDCVYLFVLWKIVKILIDSLKLHVTSSFFSAVALVADAGSSVISGALSKAKNGLGGALGYAHGKKRHNELVDSMGGSGRGGSGKGSDSGGSSEGRSKGLDSPRKDDTVASKSKERDSDFKKDIDDKSSNSANTPTPEPTEKFKPVEGFSSRDNKADLKYINPEPVNHTNPVQQGDSYREKIMRRSNAHNPAKPTKLGDYRRPVSDSTKPSSVADRANALRKVSKMKEAMKDSTQNKQ
jgi:hypothetical protein